MKTRKKYDQEFKQMTVELSHHREDISKLAEELDIKPNLLYRWRKEAKQARVAIMRKEGLRSVVRKKFVVTTYSKHNYPVVGNLLNRNFLVSGPDQVWVSDLTYIRTYQDWLYLTVIIDLWDRKVVGWSLSRSLKTVNTVIPAWIPAIKNRPITRELIFHSDRGFQSACNEFRTLLEGYGLVKRSMSRKGNC